MAYLIPFLDLVEIEYEFIVLEKQLELISEQIKVLVKQSEYTLEAKQKALDYYPENPEWHNNQKEHYEFVDYVLPRIFYNSYLVSLWAGFESAILELSKLINKNENSRLSIDDLRGSFIDRSEKFYDIQLNMELFNSKSQKRKIKEIYDLRNFIAHASGRFEVTKKGKTHKLKEMIKKYDGISTYHGSIILSKIFNRIAYLEIKKVVDYLLSKYKSTYHIGGGV